MFAFEQADYYGAEGFEIDLRLSRDGEIMLAHDDNLKRFSMPAYTISYLTAAEACKLEIPAARSRASARLITLRQLLQRFPNKSYIFDCKITSELLMDRLQALLKELNFGAEYWFLTWSAQADYLVTKYFPGAPYFPRLSITRRWGLLNLARMGRIVQPKHEILSLPPYFYGLPVFTRGQVKRLHEQGRRFIGYLVNTKEDYRRVLRCGVNTVLTDRPDLIAKWRRKPAAKSQVR